ncbi:uncharacterized protein At4g00950-like [Trifolium pratense]|uniref:uncharacterized protein At4g00950-like n=1 Tax=Trifolium pratense TaxID=57577 RepID=UPI001E690D4B|nr:uncharacterized protein At4g00950-like [Trifolium pratense]
MSSSEIATSPSPPHTTISIPFKWEEAPGKPRHCHTQSELNNNTVTTTTTLELPPRLLFLDSKLNVPSPTTVLDGPYVGRAMSFTSSYRTPRENWNSNFGSSRWSGLKKINKEGEEGSLDFSGQNKVKISRAGAGAAGKDGSPVSKAKSHLWASIYGSFKQVVPWRRRKETQRKWVSITDTV